MLKAFLLLVLLSCSPAWSAEFGSVKFLQGKVSVDGKPVREGDPVTVGGEISTGPRSMVRILLESGVAMQIGPESRVRLGWDAGKIPLASLLKGELLSRIRKGGDALKYRVHTKSVSLGVRGTTFFAKDAGPGRTFLCVCEGKVEVKWRKGAQLLISKHHDAPELIADEAAKPEPAPMGSEHTDADFAALEALLR